MSRSLSWIRGVSLGIITTLALPSVAKAHPGSGIVIDRFGNVYFLDTGAGLWKVDGGGVLTHLSGSRFHWLAMDADDRFRQTSFAAASGGTIERAGAAPSMLLSSDFPIATGANGYFYFPSRSGGSLRIMKMTVSGQASVLAALPASAIGEPLEWINGLASGPGGSVYYTENTAVRRIGADGRVSTVISAVKIPGCVAMPGIEPREGPFLRGLAVDAAGNVYVAATGCGTLIKIAADGRMTTLEQLSSPWSPTAVAVAGNDVYALEYLQTAVEDRQAWLPRVRKISNGGSAVIAAVRR